MTIEEAIRILQFQGAPEEGPTISAFIQARELGISALIAWRQHRRKKAPANLYLLPGETKD